MAKNIVSPRTTVRSPMERTSMSTSWTQPQGGTGAFIHEARVVDLNMATWTVDVRTQYDQKYFPSIQVGSPYMHPNRGEGIYAVPEIHSKCLVCIPSDGPPPYVFCFIMPMETPEDPVGNNAATGAAQTSMQTAAATAGATQGAVFSGGRTRAKPGDIIVRGRDGNFMVLHRGGVLQIGATELAQRIYIPLGNIITDISQSYEHHNTAGSINWGLSSSYTDDNPETSWIQTFRLHANDDLADVRLVVGTVHQPVVEPPGGEDSVNAGLGIGTGNSEICMELVVAPGGFVTESGVPGTDASKTSVLRLFFDTAGGAFLRAEGNVNVRIKKKLRLHVSDLEVVADNNMNLSAAGLLRVQGGKGLQLGATSAATTINGGDTPVAAVGSAVSVLVSVPIPITVTLPAGPAVGTINPGATLTGFITNGCGTVLVPKPG